jgi:hypothetical protein
LNIDQYTEAIRTDWINLVVVLTWIPSFILLLGFLAFALSIRNKLRTHYPHIWKNLARDKYPLVETRESMRSLHRLILDPPREITDKGLLRDFTLYKKLRIGQWMLLTLATLATFFVLRAR